MAANKESQLIIKPLNRWRIILAGSITLLAGIIAFHSFSPNRTSSQVQTPPPKTTAETTPVKLAVTALGRLQPQGEVTNLSAPNSVNGARVERLLVREGEEVKAGQVLAYLENYARSTAALQQSLDQLEVAKARLAQVKAGARAKRY